MGDGPMGGYSGLSSQQFGGMDSSMGSSMSTGDSAMSGQSPDSSFGSSPTSPGIQPVSSSFGGPDIGGNGGT